MVFLMVLLTFAACIFGVVAVEISFRKREDGDISSGGVARLHGPVTTAIEDGLRPDTPATPSSKERSSRAA